MLKRIAALCATFIFGCSIDYEVEEGYHSWSFAGLQNDSVAVVKVTYNERGHIHDNHIMSWQDGESFHETVSEYYYPVKMTSYWIGSRASSAENYTGDSLPKIPSCAMNSLDIGSVNKKTYCIELVELDDYGACALVLSDEKSTLDSLEFSGCRGFEDKGKVAFAANYLRVDKSLYLIADDKFPSQSPAFKIVEENRNIKFIDRNGDYVIYGGTP